ncbi:PHP domain-containing protein [Feifania hominis]|uniref:PHP domain-containing protein n=1 Tax=Feifania hominis TaxID=2763660 RepID=A0A926DE39_9FIRM|nr:PHP domain-containing protein [Feifania hominis]MBC8536152.1 PHP domain-containing protein [Feifania hominis]
MSRLAYDLHLHSCLSPCGEQEMTPHDLVFMAKLLGLDVIALTDHNTSKNCPAAMAAGREAGVLVLPGMELNCAEEVHIVCLFAELEAAQEFERFVDTRRLPVANRPEIFGRQLICDERDEIIGEMEPLLTAATQIGVYEIAALLESYGGVAVAAHIDRPSYSVLAALGFLTPDMGFRNVELSPYADEAAFFSLHPELPGDYRVLHSSDAHALGDMREAGHFLELSEVSARAVINLLKS